MGGNPATAPAGVLEAALYVDDLDRATAFYNGIIGLEEIARLEGRHVFFRCGQTIVLVFRAEETRKPATSDLQVPVHGTTGAGHLCFAAEAAELDGWRKRLETAGVAIEQDFLWRNGARSIYVRDPDGNSIEFADPQLWARP